MGWLRRARGAPAAPPEVAGRRILLAHGGAPLETLALAPLALGLLGAGARSPVGVLLPEAALRAWKALDLSVRLHALPGEGPRGEDPEARSPNEDEDQDAARIRLRVALRKPGYQLAAGFSDPGRRVEPYLTEAPLRLGPARGRPTRRRADPDAPTWAAMRSATGPLDGDPRLGLRATERGQKRLESAWPERPRVLFLPAEGDGPDVDEPALRAVSRVVDPAGIRLGRRQPGRSAEPPARGFAGLRAIRCGSPSALAAALAIADVVVGVDSPALALAELSGRPTISWGPVEDDWRRPLGTVRPPRQSRLSLPPRPPGGIVGRWVGARMVERLDGLVLE